MFKTVEKLEKRIEELAEWRYCDVQPLDLFQLQEDVEGAIGTYPPPNETGKTARIGDRWQGRDRYVWVRMTVRIPAEWKNRDVVGRFDFGRTGGGNNSGFESLLFVDGKPYQGVDSNHKEVFFPAELAGKHVRLDFRLWSGLEGGGKRTVLHYLFNQAELAWLHPDADDVYFTARAMLDTIRLFDERQPERHELLKALDRAFLHVDWSKPGSEDFYASIQQARQELERQLSRMNPSHPVKVRCIGHTHIDVAWLWRLKHTREKSARSFTTVLRLMERFPEFIFLQTQPQLYEYIQRDYPEIYERIKERVSEGRWEAAGGMWLEADCNIPSGESLVRQMLFGTRFLKQQFGVDCRYLWLPDVFGYSWALPQILKKSGIDTFMTTKISWNDYNDLPHDSFIWRGIDGTEVLAHFITTPDPGKDDPRFHTYNGVITPETVRGIWDHYQEKEVNQELLLAYGYGDGGGGVNRDMLELRRRLNRMPGLPEVVTGRADEYFDQLQRTFAHTDRYVHTWDGELYLEYHRGTYTSQAYNKKMNRKLELALRETEWLASFAAMQERRWDRYPLHSLREAWKIVLRNQFHDIIPGSSIREVYEDSRKEYEEAKRIVCRVWDDTVNQLLMDRSDACVLINSASWDRYEWVQLPSDLKTEAGFVWVSGQNEELESHIVAGRWWVKASLPASSLKTIRLLERTSSAADNRSQTVFVWDASEANLETPYYTIKWNEFGQLDILYDKDACRHVLADGERGNVLQVFEDKPRKYDAWDIDLYYQEKMKEITQLESITLIENSPFRAIVECVWIYGQSTLRQHVIVYRDSRRIDFRTTVDWHERQQLLKVAFPVDIRATEATYDIQFGNVMRPTHWNTSWDMARFESVAHQWVDLSERNYGVSLLNDCKYGHDIKDHVIRLSLIKSAIAPDTEQDQGMHEFVYALYPHVGDWVEADTVKEAWSLNQPVSAEAGEIKSGPVVSSLVNVGGEHVMIDAIKKAEDEDAIIIRVHEYAGAREKIRLSSVHPIRSWQRCDLLERPQGDPIESNVITDEIRPYELKTWLIRF